VQNSFIERDQEICTAMEQNYGKEYFKKGNIYKTLANLASSYCKNRGYALDINCSVGRASFELSKSFSKVLGLDFSARFIKVGVDLQENLQIKYEFDGDIKSVDLAKLELSKEQASRCTFLQADASNLKPIYSGFDLMLSINTLEKTYNPKKFITDIKKRLNSGGVLLIASQFEYNKLSENELKEFMRDFTLLKEQTVDYVEVENTYIYKNQRTKVLIWKK